MNRTNALCAARRGAFTLIEMLVVVTLVILLVIITVPAFTAMVASQQRVAAEEGLKRATSLGHSLALSSSNGRDIGIVFFYEPPGPMMMVACVRIAEIEDTDRRNAGVTGVVRREVFVPVGGAEPVTLPLGWSVRGYALPATIDNEWYEPAGGPSGTPRYTQGEASWVFPETSFYDVNLQGDAQRDGQNRQSFMVRFEGGTGRMSMANMNAVLVVSPRPASSSRTEPDAFRIDLAQDLERWVQRVLVSADLDANGTVDDADTRQRQRLLGDESGDTVLVKPVSLLALYNERELAGAFRIDLDKKTGSIYRYIASPSTTPPPDPFRPSYPDALLPDLLVNSWIEGQLGAVPQAKVFTIDRFTGQSKPVSMIPGSTP